MTTDFAIGCTYNFLQPSEEVPPLQRFEMVRDTGAFDYINWLPPSRILAECARASDKTGIPMTTGNCSHRLGKDDSRLAQNVRDAATVGMQLLNVMLNTYAADGHELTDQDIVDTYCRTAELGQSLGVAIGFELHVDCWSEKYKRVRPVIEAVRNRGMPFNLTLDYSHLVFGCPRGCRDRPHRPRPVRGRQHSGAMA
jgi:sugar phosphate isomerase/epimerase